MTPPVVTNGAFSGESAWLLGALSAGNGSSTPQHVGQGMLAPTDPELRAAFESVAPGVLMSPLPSATATLDGRYVLANPAYCTLVGRELEQLCELNVADVTHPEDVPRDGRALRAIARGQLRQHQIRKRYVRSDGQPVGAWTHVGAVYDARGRPVGLLAHVLEVDDEPADGPSLSDERSFRLLFAAHPQPMWIFDLETLRFLEVNDAACAHYGYTRQQFLERTIADIRAAEDAEALRAHLGAAPRDWYNGGVWRHRRADGQAIEVEVVTHEIAYDGRDAVLVTAHDVTARVALERQLIHEALHDPTSGLPNRALFLDRLGQALAACGDGSAGTVGVLYVDLDNFRLVNESLGHEGADALLRTIGARLVTRLPPTVTVASIAGEELAVCAGGLAGADSATTLAHQVAAIVAEPLTGDDGVEIGLSACVGVATANESDSDPSSLLRDATLALAQAKSVGPGRVVLLDEYPRSPAPGRLGARQELRRAIEAGDLRVYYQPIVSLSSGAVVGAEALARWSHPRRGLISPAEFIPLAEESGLIIPLGRSVLEQACQEASRYSDVDASGGPFIVAVNLSGHQLRDGQLAGLVSSVLTDTGLEPSHLALEVTETVLIDHGPAATAELGALRDLGVHLGLDDFGTGYSSLTHLDRFPFDVVKIDRSFVTGMVDDPRHQAIVTGVVGLAQSLDVVVIAEGVETRDEAVALQRLGAQLAQGYHYYVPMPAHDLKALLEAQPSLPSRAER